MGLEFWTLAIAAVTATTCALCGTLLLIGRKCMVSEGLSHAVLPGLVLAFAFTRDYNSPWLILAAAASGMIMVWLTDLIQRSGVVDDDAGLGIVYAGMFSLGIIIVSTSLRSTHFHPDCIVDGNLVLAPLDRWKVGELDLGPKSFVVMSAVLLVVLAFITLAFKELKLGVFDPVLAGKFGLRPGLLQSLWLMIVSITTVAAFNVAGSILIVSLMIAPPAAAYLLTDRLGWMLVVSAVIAIASAFGGYYLSTVLDISPTGPISSFAGLLFLCVFAAAPKRGLLAKWMLQKRGRRQTHELLVLAAVQHGGVENTDQLAIPQRCISRSIGQLERSGLIYAIQEKKGRTDFAVTEDGRLRLEQMFQDE